MENSIHLQSSCIRTSANFTYLGAKMNSEMCQKIDSLNLRTILNVYTCQLVTDKKKSN